MALIAHMSDVHLGPLPPVSARDLMSKRLLGYINWQRNRRAHFDPDVLAALVADMKAAKPDHIAVTGDLVNLGLPEEYAAARAWLDDLGAPDDVTVVPGNHDAYVAKALDHAEAWQPFATGDDGTTTFPFVRRRGAIAFVAVSTAVATLPLMATGRIETDQAQQLGLALAAAGREKLFRVVLIHHPPTPAATLWTRRLIGADLVRHAIKRFGAELVLHGHNHRTSVASLPGPDGPVPVVGAASPSSHGAGRHAGRYNLIKIAGEPGTWAVGLFERGCEDGRVTTLSKRLLAGDQPTATQA